MKSARAFLKFLEAGGEIDQTIGQSAHSRNYARVRRPRAAHRFDGAIRHDGLCRGPPYQRDRIRMALGAERRSIVWMVLREVFALTAAGLYIGLPAHGRAPNSWRSFLFGIKRDDPLSLSVSVLLLIATVSLAGYAPAWKASRIDRWLPCGTNSAFNSRIAGPGSPS
jgi:hypothetical protein